MVPISASSRSRRPRGRRSTNGSFTGARTIPSSAWVPPATNRRAIAQYAMPRALPAATSVTTANAKVIRSARGIDPPARQPGVRRPAALGAAGEPAALEQTLHPARDQRRNARHVRARESPHGVKGDHEALDDHHSAAPAVGDAVTPGATPEEPEHRPQGHAGHSPTQLVIPRQQVPQPMRQAEHPLSDRHVGQDLIDEMRRPLGHPATTAPRAESAALAREGHEAIQAACGAPKPGEAAGQTAAPQEVAKLLLDKSREPLAVPQRRGVCTEGLKMVTDDRIQDGRCGIAPVVRARWRRHAQPTRAPRANTRDRSIRRGCRDRVSEVAILTTVVATVFRLIRAPATSPAIFSARMLDPPGRRSGQLPLPFSLDGGRASSLRVVCHQPQHGDSALTPAPSARARLALTLGTELRVPRAAGRIQTL